MAETSGFFEARLNEETEEYDRLYYAEQFANYFKLFIGNGVFIQDSNQLQVESVAGMNIKVNPGWGFINGYWYNNSEELNITIPVNTFTVDRYDLVVLRKDLALREISIVYLENETNIRRDGNYYDLALAKIRIPVGSASISNSNITDKRPDEEVCGFVKGLVDIITTDALFNQFTAQFNEWFTDIKEKLEEDPAGNLQAQIGNLGELVTANKDSLVESINEVVDKIDNLSAEDIGLGTVLGSINTLNTNLQNTIYSNGGTIEEKVKWLIENEKIPTNKQFLLKEAHSGNNILVGHIYDSYSYGGFLVISIGGVYYANVYNGTLLSFTKIGTTSDIDSALNTKMSISGKPFSGDITPNEIFEKVKDTINTYYSWASWNDIKYNPLGTPGGWMYEILNAYKGITYLYLKATKVNTNEQWIYTMGGGWKKIINDGDIENYVLQYALPSKSILTSTDFNNITTTGMYHINFSSAANQPTNNNGMLIVDANLGTPFQIWMPDNSYEIYKRIHVNKTWQPWVMLCSQKGIEFQIVNGELQYRYDTEVWG